MKRYRAVMVGLILALLTACGSTKPSEPAQSPATAPSGAAAQPAQPVTIEYWHINGESFGGPSVKELVDKFNASQNKVKVVDKFQPNSYGGLIQNLQAALAAKTTPAVAILGYNYALYATKNFPALPMDSLPGAKEHMATFKPNLLSLGQQDRKQVALPFSVSVPVVYYNPTLFAAIGASGPAGTWEELAAQGEQIKARTGKYGLFLTRFDNWLSQALIESNGGAMLSPSGDKVAVDSPEAVAAIGWWREQIQKGVIPTATAQEGEAAFLRGDVAAFVSSIGASGSLKPKAQFEMKAAPLPAFRGKPRKVPAGGNNLFIFAQDKKEQDAAWDWVKFLTSAEGMTTWDKGTGYMPVLQGGESDPKYHKPIFDQNPFVPAALAVMPDVTLWANFPGPKGLEVERVVFDAISGILAGQSDAKTGLADAARRANDLLK